MGHSIHGLYTIDFTSPKFARDSVVLMADSYSMAMLGGVQQQFIDRVAFEDVNPGVVRVRIHARHGRIDLPLDYETERLPVPAVSNYEIDFQLVGSAFKVTPDTAAAAKLFGVR
jgi:hypothetical protein